jgi:hypothetical protein
MEEVSGMVLGGGSVGWLVVEWREATRPVGQKSCMLWEQPVLPDTVSR